MADPVNSPGGRFAFLSKASLWRIGKAILFGVALLALTRTLLRTSSGPELNQTAKPFQLPIAGSDALRSLSELAGKPVLVEVLASWCGACRDSAPAMHEAALAEREAPVQFIAVAIDTDRSSAEALKKSWSIPYEVLADEGRFAVDYKISMLPTFILIDESGVVKHVQSGRADRADIEEWLTKVGAAVPH